jgi:hypothetical protein
MPRWLGGAARAAQLRTVLEWPMGLIERFLREIQFPLQCLPQGRILGAEIRSGGRNGIPR